MRATLEPKGSLSRGVRCLCIVVAAALLPAGVDAAPNHRFALDPGGKYPTAYYDLGGLKDWNCGDHTYGGHTGSDFGVGSWPGMGSPIYASAEGTVIDTHDGEWDQCTSGKCAGANFVKLSHADGKITLFTHMQTGSVAVGKNAHVWCGQKLGGVGSSGPSTGPHLHFAINAGGGYDDPFTGPCGGPLTWWTSQGAYKGLPSTACDGGEKPPPPTKGTVEGWVREEDAAAGPPVVGAAITLSTGQSASTDGAGHFTVGGVEQGSVTIGVTADGYHPGAATVQVAPEQTATANIALERLVPKHPRLVLAATIEPIAIDGGTQEPDFVQQDGSLGIFDLFRGQEVVQTFDVRNDGDLAGQAVTVSFWVEGPFVRARAWTIWSDWETPGEMTLSDVDGTQGISHEEPGGTFSLSLGQLSPGETKRVRLVVVGDVQSVGKADHPDVRMWVSHVDGFYEKGGFDAEYDNVDGLQDWSGGDLRVWTEVDVHCPKGGCDPDPVEDAGVSAPDVGGAVDGGAVEAGDAAAADGGAASWGKGPIGGTSGGAADGGAAGKGGAVGEPGTVGGGADAGGSAGGCAAAGGGARFPVIALSLVWLFVISRPTRARRRRRAHG